MLRWTGEVSGTYEKLHIYAAMEEVVREHFRVGAVENTQEGCKKDYLQL